MKKVLGILFNRWTLTMLGLIAISMLIWYAGPLIAFADYVPLESETNRVILVALVIGFYTAKIIWVFIKSKNLNMRFMEGLLQQPSVRKDTSNHAGSEEITLLNERFENAISRLKDTHLKGQRFRSFFSLFNRQYVYELPWYIIIGPPGVGKTVALVNSGLQFPLAEHHGQKKIPGVGGTRNCDWWFSNEIVLLDTAGRYTTQDSHQEADSAAWNGFLKLLKKYRPRRPINGIIVTISLTDLMQQSPSQQESQANAIRDRIQELHTELNIRFPIYVLLTKMDLVGGFMEFFGKYGREERTQVWGMTFPLSEKEDDTSLVHFDAEFALLEQRLNERLIDYIRDEKDFKNRALLYAFPQQFSVLKHLLSNFLNQVFSLSRYDLPPMLRGVYFTSAMQDGNPIDRVMSSFAKALQLDSQQLIPHKSSDKSFFLTQLIKDVILKETEIAGTNLRWERQQSILQWSVFFFSITLTLSLIGAWALSYSQNQTYVSGIERKIPIVSEQVEQLPVVQNMSMTDLLTTLKSVRELATTSRVSNDSPSVSMGFGLYQGDKLEAAANNAYRKLLQDAFLPQLMLRIEYLLSHANSNNMELLYEGLKAYIMLHQPEYFDPIALKAFILIDWEISLPREFTFEQRQELESHLDALLSHTKLTSPIPFNTQLIERVRTMIGRTPLAQRIYNRLKLQATSIEIPEFTIARNVGSTSALVFERKSGLPFTKGISGLYTFDGYYNYFPKIAKEITKQLAQEEVWVLNLPEKQRNFNPLNAIEKESQVNEEVRRLYLQEYAKVWENFINDIKLIRADSLQRNIDLTRLISANDSPLLTLLKAIVKEVTLVKTDEASKNIVEKATDQVKNASKNLKQLLGRPDEKAPTAEMLSRPEYIVDERFNEFRRMVQSPVPGQPAPIEAMLNQVNELYMHLTATEEALKANTARPVSKIQSEMSANARRLNEPLRSMFAALSSTIPIENLMRGNLNQSLKTAITDFCNKATSGRYPFTKNSQQDVTQDDFAQLFSFGGRFDKFFQKELAQHVDTTKAKWRFHQVGDTPKDLQEFKHAQNIRDIFFRGGAHNASINFTFKPVDMDPGITQFILDIDGQIVKYSHGPQVPVSVQWPGPRGSAQVRLQISPVKQDGKSGQVFDGPFALFRMFDNVQITSSPQPEKFIANFDIDGRKAQFEIITSSVINPFRLQEFRDFKCPSKL